MDCAVLDVYDDQGALLQRSIPLDQLPEEMKSAHMLSPDELRRLPNDLFALVLVPEEGEPPIRKFACTDREQTALSGLYFVRTYRELTPEAVKVAAANLRRAHDVYGLPDIPILETLSRTGGLPKSACVEDHDVRVERKQIKDHLEEGEAKEEGKEEKKGDLTGTEVMPRTPPPPKTKKVPPAKKLGSSNVVSGRGTPVRELLPRHVPARRYALWKSANDRRYPIDTLSQIMDLEQALGRKLASFPPDERPQICRALHRREQELGLPIPSVVQKYAGKYYQPDTVIRAWFDLRKELSARDATKQAGAYDRLFEKRAALHPLEFARELAVLDRERRLDYHWGSRLADPWESVLAFRKEATVVFNRGEIFVTDQDLQDLVKSREALAKILDEDVLDEFRKDPVGVFRSLPDPLKRTIGRLAMDDSETVRPGLVR